MADFVELGAEAINHVTDKHFDKGYDRYRKWVNGEKTESVVTPYERKRDSREGGSVSASRRDSRDDGRDPAARSEARSRGDGLSQRQQPESPREMRSSAAAAAARAPPDASYTATSYSPADQTTRRRDRDTVPQSERDTRARTATAAVAGAATGAFAGRYIPPPSSYPSRRDRSLERESTTTDNILTDYERERDDPPCRPEKILPASQLNRISKSSGRRDSAMTSRYGDDYREGGSQYAPSRPRSQPPRSRYDDDGDDSDYDERTGRRSRANGRGYDDRDYDRVVEETERYRGPRRDDRGYDDDRTYASGAAGGTVAQYDRGDRRSGDCDRDRDTYVSRRRSRSRRGDDYYEDDRSRDGDRGDRKSWKDKVEKNFDTSTQGLGAGLAGAVIGGLAGREFGAKSRHSERDIAIGAIIGGLGANLAEAKWREWKDKKEGKLDREEDRWEQKWDGNGGQSGIGRSRSNVR